MNPRTGSLRRSVKATAHRPTGKTGVAEISVGSIKGPSSPYAKFHEDGGKNKGYIRPVKGKWLTIPQQPAKTPAGVHKYSSARQVPVKLSFVPTKKKDTALLVERKGSGEFTVWYVLKKEVYIEPRHWLSLGVESGLGKVSRAIERGLVDHLKRSV